MKDGAPEPELEGLPVDSADREGAQVRVASHGGEQSAVRQGNPAAAQRRVENALAIAHQVHVDRQALARGGDPKTILACQR